MIQTGMDRAMVAPIATKPIAADKMTNPASISRNLHEKTLHRMLALRGKTMAGSWLKFVAASKRFGGSMPQLSALWRGFRPLVMGLKEDNPG